MPTSGTKYEEGAAGLPEELRPIYRQLVEQYEFLTISHYGRGYVAYKVLADLILSRWRDVGPRHVKSKI